MVARPACLSEARSSTSKHCPWLWCCFCVVSGCMSCLGAEQVVAITGAVDDKGVYTDTEDVDCAVCKCDMWLCAVVSTACPGKAVCTEHATQLGCTRQEQLLLFRCAWRFCLVPLNPCLSQLCLALPCPALPCLTLPDSALPCCALPCLALDPRSCCYTILQLHVG